MGGSWSTMKTARTDGTFVWLYWPKWCADPMIGRYVYDAWHAGPGALVGRGGPVAWYPILVPAVPDMEELDGQHSRD
jgi:hypothetical protein